MRHEPRARRALARETAILQAIRHPALPRLIEQGEDAHGPYLVQTAHPGLPLRSLVEGLVARHGRVPPPTLRAIAVAAFDALQAIHRVEDAAGGLSLVHGDLGPDHVIVGPARKGQRGRVGFVDFGQARARDLPGGAGERGTLPYVAPEVLRAERELEQSADVFALAATMAYAALGRDPCRAVGASARLVECAERGLDLAALEGLAELGALTEVLRDALVFEPSRRLSSASEVFRRLLALEAAGR